MSFVINQGDYTGFTFTPLHIETALICYLMALKKKTEREITGCSILIIKRKEWLFLLCSLADLQSIKNILFSFLFKQ